MEQNKTIFKNYTEKIKNKTLKNASPVDINNMIIFLNWCFVAKNNFFVPNFNTKVIRNVCLAYNQIKTNVLTNENKFIFANINPKDLNLLKFILSSYVNNFGTIDKDIKNDELCSTISTESILKCVSEIRSALK